MYARVTTLYLKVAKHKEVIDIYQNSVIPEASKQKGFVDAYFFVNRNMGKFVSITIWENMDYAIENQKSGYYQTQIDKFNDYMVVAPEIEPFDVAAWVLDKK